MSKTSIPFRTITPAMLTAAGSADVNPILNYVLVTDDSGNLHHMEVHAGKYYASGVLNSVASAVTMLRNPATD